PLSSLLCTKKYQLHRTFGKFAGATGNATLTFMGRILEPTLHETVWKVVFGEVGIPLGQQPKHCLIADAQLEHVHRLDCAAVKRRVRQRCRLTRARHITIYPAGSLTARGSDYEFSLLPGSRLAAGGPVRESGEGYRWP